MKIVTITTNPTGPRFTEHAAAMTAAGLTATAYPRTVDARAMTADRAADPLAYQFASWTPGLTRGQIGCTLSHIRAMHDCAADTQPWLVLEDDAAPIAALWDSAAIEAAVAEQDVLLLHVNTADRDIEQTETPTRHPITLGQRFSFSTCAIAYTPEGARRLLNFFRRPVPPDAPPGLDTHEHEGAPHYYRAPEGIDRIIARLSTASLVGMAVMLPCPFTHAGTHSTTATAEHLVPLPKTPDPQTMPLGGLRRMRIDASATALRAALIDGIPLTPKLAIPGTAPFRADLAARLVLLDARLQAAPDAAAKQAILDQQTAITAADGRTRLLTHRQIRGGAAAYAAAVDALETQHAARVEALRAAKTREAILAVL